MQPAGETASSCEAAEFKHRLRPVVTWRLLHTFSLSIAQQFPDPSISDFPAVFHRFHQTAQRDFGYLLVQAMLPQRHHRLAAIESLGYSRRLGEIQLPDSVDKADDIRPQI